MSFRCGIIIFHPSHLKKILCIIFFCLRHPRANLNAVIPLAHFRSSWCGAKKCWLCLSNPPLCCVLSSNVLLFFAVSVTVHRWFPLRGRYSSALPCLTRTAGPHVQRRVQSCGCRGKCSQQQSIKAAVVSWASCCGSLTAAGQRGSAAWSKIKPRTHALHVTWPH